MPKIMLVNVTHMEESRVAVLDGGVLAAYEIETINRTNIKGNIHNAVVESVHPSLEAAFVKLAPDLKGFLPLDEVNFKLLPVRSDSRKTGRIGQHLHPGQKIMAQVVREPFSGKPPSVSTYFSLPGRYLVLMPGVDSSGISRKIEDQSQRDRLQKMIDEIRLPDGFGIIIRTAGMGQTKTEIQRDLRYLLRLWESIQRGSQATEFPGLVYREADLVIRTIRDHFTPDIGEVWIDSEETYEKALAFVRDVMPGKAKTLHLYTGDRPLFNKYNLEEQIEKIYKRCVPLPSGGEIVIDGTEALTAIDVNSARSRKQSDVEENATETNLEAAAEIARQLRLRDLGGLVVIDFIDMHSSRNKSKVEKALRDAMRGDRAKHDFTKISKLGLMEIARQRVKGAKLAASYATCPGCDGHGLIKNVEASALAALRKLQARTVRKDLAMMRIFLPPEVAAWVLNNKREELLRIEQRHGLRVEITGRESMLRHEVSFETRLKEKSDLTQAPALATGSSAAGKDARPAAEVTSGGQASANREEQGHAAPKQPLEDKSAVAGAVGADGTATSGSKPTEEQQHSRKRRRKRRTKPGKPDEQTRLESEEPASGSSPATAQDGDKPSSGSPRPRTRRRRGGRGKSSRPAPESNTQGTEQSASESVAAVPRGIRGDELMPAAVGGSGKKRPKRGSRKSSSRRR